MTARAPEQIDLGPFDMPLSLDDRMYLDGFVGAATLREIPVIVIRDDTTGTVRARAFPPTKEAK